MCKCWKMEPCDRPTFAELRSHFEGLLEGQHGFYVDFTASLAPNHDQEKEKECGVKVMADEGMCITYACL